jgi:Trk K+ transport system NAD-binding subunit/Kef-type K+ transport system membrane component KefB
MKIPLTEVIHIISFFLLCFSAHRVGQLFSKLKLPYISGYLLAGVLFGGSVLNLLPSGVAKELGFVQSITLGVIAFIAGSELYLKELRKQVKTILLISTGIIVVMLILGSVLIFFLTDYIPFTKGMVFNSRIAVALLGATVLLALSPPSTIAVIKEMRAKGKFTRTALSVTVCIDVAIVFLFAIGVSFVEPLLEPGKHFDLRFLFLLTLDLIFAIAGGFLAGKCLEFALSSRLPSWVKMVIVAGIGYAIFFGSSYIKTHTDKYGPFEIHIEPLLTAMLAGIYITNFTNYRKIFEDLLQAMSGMTYVAFFMLTGLALDVNLLIEMLPFAGALFLTRIFSIFVGSYTGGMMAGESKRFRRVSWMAFITQAGIALGLAGEAGMHFPTLGTAFSTLIVSVILLNEIFGPLFLKNVLRLVGESNLPEAIDPKAGRRAVILGIEGQSLALARQLEAQNWHVVMADTDAVRVDLVKGKTQAGARETYHLDLISENALGKLFEQQTDAFVAMMDDDQDNLRACRYILEKHYVRMIARLNNFTNAEKFREMGVFVLDPNSAMVNLMEQAIRAPQSAALLLHQDELRKVEQVTILNPSIDGMLVRDLRMPADVLILDIIRKGEVIVPNGYTRLKKEDDVTIIGSPEDIEVVRMRVGY